MKKEKMVYKISSVIYNFIKSVIYNFIKDFSLWRPPSQICGKRWEIHKSDFDPFPSYPHMHEIDGKEKMDIYTGKVYLDKKYIYSANKKEMVGLWNNDKFYNIVIDYRKKYDKIGLLPSIPEQYRTENKENFINIKVEDDKDKMRIDFEDTGIE
jgi:hypothetical protein